jgi:type II secretory pathway predicted ATPase ExeA
MYEAFYELRERPFDRTSNPRFLLLTSRHREALSNLQYGIASQKGLTLLLGEAGTGKTTLVRAALTIYHSQQQDIRIVHLSNPTLTRAEFVEYLANGFGLSGDAARSKTQFLMELTESAARCHRAGGVSALIVDEAQSTPHELLEEIRLLSNIEDSSGKLVPVVLVGQPELADRLNNESLRQLKQRVALRCSLEPLDLRETAAYITKRIRIAGGDGAKIFTRDAVAEVFARSRGIPRTVNVICDNALVNGFALQRRPVGVDVIREVCRDFDFEPSVETPVPEERPGDPIAPEGADTLAVAAAGANPRGAVGTSPSAVEPAVSSPPSADMFSVFRRRRRFSFF